MASSSGEPNPDIGTVKFHVSMQEFLSLQIRLFLDASDEVDIPAEVADDLMQSMPPDDQDDHEEDLDNIAGSENNMDGVEIISKDGEVSISSVFNPNDAAGGTWTKQEIKQMLHHLKERGSRSFVTEYVASREIPIPKLLHAFGIALCPELLNKPFQSLMYFLEVGMSFQLRKREKLPQYNTFEDAKKLIQESNKILVLTGAGISVSCGIPDFRSRNGLYATLKQRGEYDLDDPQQMFDINYFRENPAVSASWQYVCVVIQGFSNQSSFAREIYPAKFQPSPCHKYIKRLETQGKLLRNYTQNIDTLEAKAGIDKVIQCHGSFSTATCIACHRQVPGTDIEDDILQQRVPLCATCNSAPPPPAKKRKPKKGKKAWEESESEDDHSAPPLYPPGIMKPDITFFGEKLDDSFDKALQEDRDRVDLLLVIGTSLKVAPVADILSHIPHSVPQILINKTPIRHINPDIVLLGDADEVIKSLNFVPRKGHAWAGGLRPAWYGPLPPMHNRVDSSHVTLFRGADGGPWLQELRRQLCIDAKAKANSGDGSPSTNECGEEESESGTEDSARERKRQKLASP